MLVKFILRWAKLAGEFCWPLATSVVARTGPDIKYIKKNPKFEICKISVLLVLRGWRRRHGRSWLVLHFLSLGLEWRIQPMER